MMKFVYINIVVFFLFLKCNNINNKDNVGIYNSKSDSIIVSSLQVNIDDFDIRELLNNDRLEKVTNIKVSQIEFNKDIDEHTTLNKYQLIINQDTLVFENLNKDSKEFRKIFVNKKEFSIKKLIIKDSLFYPFIDVLPYTYSESNYYYKVNNNVILIKGLPDNCTGNIINNVSFFQVINLKSRIVYEFFLRSPASPATARILSCGSIVQ